MANESTNVPHDDLERYYLNGSPYTSQYRVPEIPISIRLAVRSALSKVTFPFTHGAQG